MLTVKKNTKTNSDCGHQIKNIQLIKYEDTYIRNYNFFFKY